jgi:hypothetical protein
MTGMHSKERAVPADPYRDIRAALRRELERKRLRDGIWKDLVHWGFAEQVLRGLRTIEWLANAYRIKEEDYHPQRRARPHREPPADRRAQALAQIVALRLDWLLPAMALFRERHLEGGYLSVEEMAGWITGQAAAEGPPLRAALPVPVAGYGEFPAGDRQERRAWYLDFLDRERKRVRDDPDSELPPAWAQSQQSLSYFSPALRTERLEIRGDGVLAFLKRIAQDIVEYEHTGWNEAEAVLFVLTEEIPPVPLGRISYIPAVVPAASHVALSVSPRLSPREVAGLFGQMRDRVLGGHDKPFTDKYLALAVFVEKTWLAGQSWVELRSQWNETYRQRHPTWCYDPDTDPAAVRFSLEARTCWRRVTGSTWLDRRKRHR